MELVGIERDAFGILKDFLALEGILRDLYSHSRGFKWFHGILRDSLALEGIFWP